MIDPVLDYDHRAGRTEAQFADRIVAYIREHDLDVHWILETHAHADHLTSAPYLKEQLGGTIAIGEGIRAVQRTFKSIFSLIRPKGVLCVFVLVKYRYAIKASFINKTQEIKMANEGYHEPIEELTDKTKDMHKAIVSLMEELEAIDWYNQRADACKNEDLRAILEHNRDEEKEHAAMVLEWIRRQDPVFDKELKDYLFTEMPIAHK